MAGDHQGENFPLRLYSCYFVDIFSINSSKNQQNTQKWRSRWLVCGSVAGLYYVQYIVTWSFCFFLCILLSSPSLHVCRRWENCRESCTKLPFLSFLLKSHVTVGQKLFSLLEVRGRWNGWWISKEKLYILIFLHAGGLCLWWCGQGSTSLHNLYWVCSGESLISSWVQIYLPCQVSLDTPVEGIYSAFPSQPVTTGENVWNGNTGCTLPFYFFVTF